MSRTLGFAIIGCGNIGPFHAEAIQKIEGTELRASCDTAEEKARELAGKFGGDFYADYREMLKRDDIDVVNICLPSGMHEQMSVDAANAGKHVIVEKPLDVTLEKCDHIIETCEKNNVKLAVIFPSRFKPAYQSMKKALDEGRFGKVVLGDAAVKWYRSQEYYDSGGWRGTWEWDGGGALMNQSIHSIDVLQWLMGPVKSIYAYCDTLVRKIEVEDTAVAVLRFKSGALGVIQGTTSIYPGLDARVCIHGEHGTAIAEGEKLATWEFLEKKPEDEALVPEASGTSSGAKDPTKFITSEGHSLQIADMVKAINENRTPFVDGHEGRKAVEIIRGIYESAKQRREIELPL